MAVMFIDNSDIVLEQFEENVLRALETCGLKGERYAKENLTKNKSVRTGTLRNSMTHEVDPSEPAVYIGTNTEYSPYVELGTGIHAEGGGGRPTQWGYQDEKGNTHWTGGQRAKPYLKPAVSEHINEYRTIFERELKNG